MHLKRKYQYVKGFTMVEIIIAMIISAILVGFALNILENLLNTGNSISSKSSSIDEVIFLSDLVNEISFSAAEIYSYDELDLCFKNDEVKTLISFSQSLIILSNGTKCDTIRAQWRDLVIRKDESNLVTDFSFNLISGSIIFPFFVKKEYPSALLFNLENQGL